MNFQQNQQNNIKSTLGDFQNIGTYPLLCIFIKNPATFLQGENLQVHTNEMGFILLIAAVDKD